MQLMTLVRNPEYDENGKLVLLEDQLVIFECSTSPWYFAEGHWMTGDYKNGSSSTRIEGQK